MKRLLWVLFLLCASFASAQTVLPNTGMTNPGSFQSNWAPLVQANYVILDNLFGGSQSAVSILATGIMDGKAPVTITTSTPVTLGGTYKSGYTFNEDATAGAAITYNLPIAAAGLQYCVGNAYNGSAPNTGVLTVATSASGQFIIFTDGTLSATGGNVTSGGAGGDAACVVGVDSTHWMLYTQRGTWTKH